MAEDIVSNVNVPVFPVPGVTATIFTVAVLRRSPYILEGIINRRFHMFSQNKNTFKLIALGLIMVLTLALVGGCSKAAGDKSEQAMQQKNEPPAQVNIQDMAGRTVAIPGEVKSILALHPIPTYMLWQLAPDKMVSKDKVFDGRYLAAESVKAYPDTEIDKLKKLPVTGVFFKGTSPEQILQLNPDVIITLTKDPQIDKLAGQVNLPVIAVSKDTLADYEESMRLLGKIVGNEAQANKLADWWRDNIRTMSQETGKIPQDEKPRVYFTGASDILTTPGESTIMASILKLAGGNNVATELSGKPTDESIPLSMEQILKWDPQVIITWKQTTKDQIMNGAEWKNVSAVKNGRVYVQPRYANMDGVTALVGMIWAHGKLYHDNDANYDKLFEDKMIEFYSLFHNNLIKPEQIVEVAE